MSPSTMEVSVIGGLAIANVEFTVFGEFMDNRSTRWLEMLASPRRCAGLCLEMTIKLVKNLRLIDSVIFKRATLRQVLAFIFLQAFEH